MLMVTAMIPRQWAVLTVMTTMQRSTRQQQMMCVTEWMITVTALLMINIQHR
jgi:hypothetical protein